MQAIGPAHQSQNRRNCTIESAENGWQNFWRQVKETASSSLALRLLIQARPEYHAKCLRRATNVLYIFTVQEA
jgi:hypothetical protein